VGSHRQPSPAPSARVVPGLALEDWAGRAGLPWEAMSAGSDGEGPQVEGFVVQHAQGQPVALDHVEPSERSPAPTSTWLLAQVACVTPYLTGVILAWRDLRHPLDECLRRPASVSRHGHARIVQAQDNPSAAVVLPEKPGAGILLPPRVCPARAAR